jgi:putative ABC transport system permease protein
MLKNYISIAVRNLLKHKVFSLINITGLAIGIACCTLLALYIKDEFSYEKHFANADQIYRITSTFKTSDGDLHNPRTSPPIAMAVRANLPEVVEATRVVSPPEVEQHLIQYKDKSFYERKGYLVDSTFFKVFSYDFKEGSAATALRTASSVVLTASVAEKLFGQASALDELLIITSGSSVDTFRVSGVLQPTKQKSHVDADFYMSMNSKGWGQWISSINTWAGQNFIQSYILLKENTLVSETEGKLATLLEKNGGKELREAGMNKTLHLQALTDIHLHSSHYQGDLGDKGNITYLYILSSIGIFILLIACINFINLTTAKASQRAGEVGVRKTMGATRSSLIYQFLGESILLVVMATLLAMILVQVSLPFFNYVTQKDLSLTGINLLFLIGSLFAIALVTGFGAGSYPALYLSSFQPAIVLKNKRLSGGGSNWLRRGLVVVQFVISITLISALAIIYSQMEFIQSQSLGFNPEYNVTIPLRTAEAKASYDNLKNTIQNLSGVSNVSASTSLPATPLMRDFSLYKKGSNMQEAIHHFVVFNDEEYFKTLGIKLVAGREFVYNSDSSSWSSAKAHVLVNEESLKQLGIPLSEAIGATLYTEWRGQIKAHEIIGVVENFHQMSLHQKIEPLIFQLPASRNEYVYVTASIAANSYKSCIESMQEAWTNLNPNTPFESMLLSQQVKQQYEADSRMAMMITSFTSIAIIISCLGLYGLSIYVAERKTKEIGIRKVMGASISSLVSMLSTDFLKLIAIAFLIAVPISYYLMNEWLQTFSFRVEMNVWIFIVAGLVSFMIAWVAVGFESVKAAVNNPVDSLRNE